MRLGRQHVIIAALALCAVTGCSLAVDNPSSGSTSSSKTATSAQAKIGQPLTVTDPTGASAQATVVSVVSKSTGTGDLAEAPANGQYAVITIQFKGIKGSFAVDPLDVQYQAANGNTYDITAGNAVTAGYNPQLPTGSVAAGASSGGVVVVDTPAGAPKEIKLTDALGSVLGTWTP
jgi:hypothetical protein